RLLKLFLADATGLHTWQLIKSKNLASGSTSTANATYNALLRVTYYAGLAAILLVTGTWPLFLIYWLLPLLTILQVIVRWAAICEHKYNLINPTIVESTPFIKLRWWESLLLPDLKFHTFHIYHHWYPAIPYWKLNERSR